MASWIETIMDSMGVWGIAFLMFLENVFPPIPSELIMTLAGFSASRGETSIVLVIVAGSLGSVAGAVFWYGIGRMFDHERVKSFADRHGRWITLTRADIERTDDWFDRYGHWAVLFGRLIPTIRTLISLPAGLSEMAFWRFLAFTSIGTAAWTTFLALCGYWLGSDYHMLEEWLDPVSLGVVALVAAIYIWRFVTFPATHRDGRE
ncbi:DedA family protein [Alcaligenaceae bacterium]|nr:DedA family protein [Alcaligenaceae bacterium]